MKRELNKKLAIIAFITPAYLLFFLVIAYPVIKTFITSFCDWDGLSKPVFIGLENYYKLFQDKDFFIANKNSLIFAAVLVVYQIGLGTFFAIVLASDRIKGKRFFKNAFFIPVVLSVTVVCQLWLSIYNGHTGLLNKLFEVLGMDYRQNWLGNTKTAMIAVALVNAWQFMGYHLILLYTAIKGIPEYYFEAAKLDGASSLKMHTKITLPLLGETYKFSLIMAVTGGLKAFDHISIMTGGGPGVSTFTPTFYMYRSLFRLNQYGYASASIIILVLECILFSIIVNKVIAREKIVY